MSKTTKNTLRMQKQLTNSFTDDTIMLVECLYNNGNVPIKKNRLYLFKLRMNQT